MEKVLNSGEMNIKSLSNNATNFCINDMLAVLGTHFFHFRRPRCGIKCGFFDLKLTFPDQKSYCYIEFFWKAQFLFIESILFVEETADLPTIEKDIEVFQEFKTH